MRDDGDLVYILKAMKTTLKQNVTGINMQPGLKKSEAEDPTMHSIMICCYPGSASTLSFGYFAMYPLLYRIYRPPV